MSQPGHLTAEPSEPVRPTWPIWCAAVPRLALASARVLAGALTGILAAALAGCASEPKPLAEASLHLDPGRPLTLLGEVHDNAVGHALRLRAFEARLARGDRPALLMEQFDAPDQAALDAARRRLPPPSAAELIAAVAAGRVAHGGQASSAAPAGWRWSFYEPFIERALRHGLPIVAVNVGRDEARLVLREGLAARGYDATVPQDILAGQAAAIEASHCGQVGGTLARRMALAQVARDQQMARAVATHAARGVVLLAGNGHVRNDLGVPRWLDPALRRVTQSVGVLEAAEDASAFDLHVLVPPQPRPDPCAAMGGARPAARPGDRSDGR